MHTYPQRHHWPTRRIPVVDLFGPTQAFGTPTLRWLRLRRRAFKKWGRPLGLEFYLIPTPAGAQADTSYLPGVLKIAPQDNPHTELSTSGWDPFDGPVIKAAIVVLKKPQHLMHELGHVLGLQDRYKYPSWYAADSVMQRIDQLPNAEDLAEVAAVYAGAA